MSSLEPLQLQPSGTGFSLVMYSGEPATAADVYALGHEPNGYFWESLARYLVDRDVPGLAAQLSYSGDGDTFVADAATEVALIALGELMVPMATDLDALTEVVTTAEAAGHTFED